MQKQPFGKFPSQLRDYWHGFAVDCVMLDAQLLKIVPEGKILLGSLPRHIYREVIAKIAEVRDAACLRELALGKRDPIIGQDLTAAIWNFLKQWSQNPDVPVPLGPALHADESPS